MFFFFLVEGYEIKAESHSGLCMREGGASQHDYRPGASHNCPRARAAFDI